MVGCTHSLLSHLTLIHITRRLIVLWEWLHSGNHTQNIDGIKFLMCGVRSYIFFLTCYGHIQLFKRTNPFSSTNFQISYRSNKSSDSGCHKNTREELILLTLLFICTLIMIFTLLLSFFLVSKGWGKICHLESLGYRLK